jgi:uncharacterized protein
LHVQRSAEIVARANNLTAIELLEIIQRGKQRLFESRETRIKPGRDEKVLTAWNGLMLRSFAEASSSLERDDYRAIAVRNAEFLLSHLRRDGQVLRSYKDGQARFNGYLDDYAFLIDGLLSLYEATFDLRWIQASLDIAEAMIAKFRDPQERNFYFTSDDHEALIHRPKELFDNAIPSGNSVAAHVLLRIWKLTGNSRFSEYAAAILETMAGIIAQQPSAFAHLLCALDFFLGHPKEIAIVGIPCEEKTRELLRAVFRGYLPNKVVACGTDGGVFLLENRLQINGAPTAYVCENFTCKLPVTTAEDLANLLTGDDST